MGRPKIIDDKTLIELISLFYVEECKSNPRKLKKPSIAAFVASKGYPDYRVESLRRNHAACEYIENLKESGTSNTLIKISSYKTLDVDSFLAKNSGIPALKKALVELDTYYKTIADTTMPIVKENQTLAKANEELSVQIYELKEQLKELQGTIQILKKKISSLKNKNKLYSAIINDYVYPDIANLLLSETELKNMASIIDRTKLEQSLITKDTNVLSFCNHKNIELLPDEDSEVSSSNFTDVVDSMFNNF